jgi:hypothetical protein
MGGTCSKYGREERCMQGLMGEAEGKVHLEDQGVDERIIFSCIFRKWTR